MTCPSVAHPLAPAAPAALTGANRVMACGNLCIASQGCAAYCSFPGSSVRPAQPACPAPSNVAILCFWLETRLLPRVGSRCTVCLGQPCCRCWHATNEYHALLCRCARMPPQLPAARPAAATRCKRGPCCRLCLLAEQSARFVTAFLPACIQIATCLVLCCTDFSLLKCRALLAPLSVPRPAAIGRICLEVAQRGGPTAAAAAMDSLRPIFATPGFSSCSSQSMGRHRGVC